MSYSSTTRRPRRLSRSAMQRRTETRNVVLVSIAALVFGLPGTLFFATCLGAALANDFTVVHALGRVLGL